MALIITATRGSGKSLLRRICNSHPDIELTDGFKNFKKLNIPHDEHIKVLRKNRYKYYPLVHSESKLWSFIRSEIFFFRYVTTLQAHRGKEISAGDAEAVLRYIHAKASVVCDVDSQYINIPDKLVSESGLSITIICRDCRDLTATLFSKIRNKRPDKPWISNYKSAEQVAKKWVYDIEQTEQYADKIHLIRYEDLVTNSQILVESFGKWLRVNPEGFCYEMTHTKEIGQHRKHLSDKEVKNIIAIAGPTMARVGYI